MEDIMVLDELEQVKSLAVPLRVRMLKLLNEVPMTVSDLAEALDERRNRLYYHVTELEKNGILEVAETRQKGNLIEKLYQPAARLFRIDPSIFQQGSQGQEVFFQTASSLTDNTLRDIQDAIARELFIPEEMQQTVSLNVDYRLSREDAALLSREVMDLMKRWKERSAESPGERRTRLSVIVYSKLPEDRVTGGN